jgi:hypothetical protein
VAATAGHKQLGSCVAGNEKYEAVCIDLKVNPRGDVPSAEATGRHRRRFQQFLRRLSLRHKISA